MPTVYSDHVHCIESIKEEKKKKMGTKRWFCSFLLLVLLLLLLFFLFFLGGVLGRFVSVVAANCKCSFDDQRLLT